VPTRRPVESGGSADASRRRRPSYTAYATLGQHGRTGLTRPVERSWGCGRRSTCRGAATVWPRYRRKRMSHLFGLNGPCLAAAELSIKTCSQSSTSRNPCLREATESQKEVQGCRPEEVLAGSSRLCPAHARSPTVPERLRDSRFRRTTERAGPLLLTIDIRPAPIETIRENRKTAAIRLRVRSGKSADQRPRDALRHHNADSCRWSDLATVSLTRKTARPWPRLSESPLRSRFRATRLTGLPSRPGSASPTPARR
jgi:hypothetical protein